MFKVVALLAIVGAASAGNLGYAGLGYNAFGLGVAAPVVAAAVPHAYAADAAALTRNVHIQANGAVAGAVRDAAHINGAILQNDFTHANAAARDQANLAHASNTQAVINADGAARNAVASAAINQYAAVRDATIQGAHLGLARSYAAAVPVPVAAPVAAVAATPVAYGAYGAGLGYAGVSALNAAAYGVHGLPALTYGAAHTKLIG